MVKLDPASLARLRPYPKTMLMFGNVVPLLLYGRLWPSFGLGLMLGAFVRLGGGHSCQFHSEPHFGLVPNGNVLIWNFRDTFWSSILEKHKKTKKHK